MIALVASLYNGRLNLLVDGFNELLNNSSILDTILLDDASRPLGFGLACWVKSVWEDKKIKLISYLWMQTKNQSIKDLKN